MKPNQHIVCLGGGIGTVNLLRGLKHHTQNISVILSMADDGGSAGRLRRLYKILPPGDLISCMAAMSDDPLMQKFLTYRFPGDRYGKDEEIAGNKLGSFMLVALRDLVGDFHGGVSYLQKMLNIPGEFLGATTQEVAISATTVDGKDIQGEMTIDLGLYEGQKGIKRLYLHPADATPNPAALAAIESADSIIIGPGDLYSNLLPILLVPQIAQTIKDCQAKKIFIVNCANKPEETAGYTVSDYVNAFNEHLGFLPFEIILVNQPENNGEQLVVLDTDNIPQTLTITTADVADLASPRAHDSGKLAKAIVQKL